VLVAKVSAWKFAVDAGPLNQEVFPKMHLKGRNPSEVIKALSFCIFSVLLLSYGFSSNCWHVAKQQWFVTHQRDSESFVVGRMVKSRQDGILSSAGLTGFGIGDNVDPANSSSAIQVQDDQDDWPSNIQVQYQYLAYSNGLTFDRYTAYMSQNGGQGMLFSLLDRLIPLSPQTKLAFFYTFASVLSAVALSLIVLWFYTEFGLCVAMFVVSSTVFSQWLTVFGRNLWWSIWAFYLPMIVIMYFLKHNRVRATRHSITFGVLVFISVFLKCLVNGYEYITTTLIMMMVPLVYYSILDKLSTRQFIKGTFVAALGSFLAIFLSLTILCFQIASIKGSVLAGIDHIVFSLMARTHGHAHDFPTSYAASLNSSTVSVIIIYLKGTFFNLNNYLSMSNPFVSWFVFRIRYIYLIVLFLAMSLLILLNRNEHISAKQRQNHIALILAAWFSIFAPLSWYIIFKAHSFEHPNINYILWQMPFTLFGFAVCGIAASSVFTR
jgi:hypothetical protein